MTSDDAGPTGALTGAQECVEALVREGVDHVFGLPGTTVMNLIDALGARRDVRYVSTRHEQVAAFMADGFSRGSGRLGVCMASRGPGAANLAIGVHNAHAEAVPLLALIGQVPDGFAQRDSFEEMDLVTFFRPMSKWQTEIHVAERIPELVQRACRTALSGRPGAVLVSLPLDLQTRTVAEPIFRPRWRAPHPWPAPDDVAAAAALLRGASRPVIIVGGGMPSHHPALVELAETLSAPVVTTYLRNSRYPHTAGTYLGGLGYGAAPVTDAAVKDADVVVALGVKMSEFTTTQWTMLSDGVQLVHVDVDEHVLGRVYVPAVGIPADAAATVDELVVAVRKGAPDDGGGGRAERLAELRRAFADQTVPEPAPGGREGTVSSQAILAALQPIVDREETALVIDAPAFSTWVHRYLRFRHPNSFYGAAGGSMGWGFPAAMGIKLARPEKDVVAVVGDGSFAMVAQDVETAVREDIPVVIVVTNNFAFGNTRDRQRFAFGERYHGVFLNNPDFAAYAQLLGAHGERVTRDDDVRDAIERAVASGRPAVVDCIQDQMEGLPGDLVPPGIPPRPTTDDPEDTGR